MISCLRKKLKISQIYHVSTKNAYFLYEKTHFGDRYTKMTTDITLIEKHPLSFFGGFLRIITKHPKNNVIYAIKPNIIR